MKFPAPKPIANIMLLAAVNSIRWYFWTDKVTKESDEKKVGFAIFVKATAAPKKKGPFVIILFKKFNPLKWMLFVSKSILCFLGFSCIKPKSIKTANKYLKYKE